MWHNNVFHLFPALSLLKEKNNLEKRQDAIAMVPTQGNKPSGNTLLDNLTL
jgi:hypothetical protein